MPLPYEVLERCRRVYDYHNATKYSYESVRAHQRYKKVIRRSTKFHAHDEQNQAHVGDLVRIVETKPLSKTKRWRLAEVLEQAK